MTPLSPLTPTLDAWDEALDGIIDAGMHPRRGQREEKREDKRAGQDRGEGRRFRTIHRSASK